MYLDCAMETGGTTACPELIAINVPDVVKPGHICDKAEWCKFGTKFRSAWFKGLIYISDIIGQRCIVSVESLY